MSFSKYEAWLQQDDLFSGSKIYLLATSVVYNQQSLTAYSPTTKVDPSVQAGETSVGDSVNYNRRKGQNSYDGINNINFSINGDIDLNNLGSINSYQTITPGILFTCFANGNKTFRFYDGKIGSAWINDPTSGVQSPYNSSTGIPVVLVDYNITAGESDNILSYSLTLREDKT